MLFAGLPSSVVVVLLERVHAAWCNEAGLRDTFIYSTAPEAIYSGRPSVTVTVLCLYRNTARKKEGEPREADLI